MYIVCLRLGQDSFRSFQLVTGYPATNVLALETVRGYVELRRSEVLRFVRQCFEYQELS